MDGRHDLAAVQRKLSENFDGQIFDDREIEKIIRFLDEQYFLETPRFQAHRAAVDSNFKTNPLRPAFFADKAYPGDPGKLRPFIDSFFLAPGGPGILPEKTQAPAVPGATFLIAPHIDFNRGAAAYAHAYLELARSGKPDLIFLFGTAHLSPDVPFVLTQKDFVTPLGLVETDKETVAKLAGLCRWDPFADETLHRTEHSLEFQAVMLSYLYGFEVKIVPVLCGTFPAETADEALRLQRAGMQQFLNLVSDMVAAPGRSAGVIAAADLAHVGRKFGDDFDIQEEVVQKIEARDREDLNCVLQGEADSFYASVMSDQNERRVCGANCIYAALKATPQGFDSGRLLYYNYADDPAGGMVSFASVVRKKVMSFPQSSGGNPRVS